MSGVGTKGGERGGLVRWLSSVREFIRDDPDPRIADEQRRTVLERAKVSSWLALVVIPITIGSFIAAFYPERFHDALVMTLVANGSIALLLLALTRRAFDARPHLAVVLLLGVICNATEATMLSITGGPAESAFLFPYYLIYFAVATLFPAPFGAVVTTTLLLPAGFVAAAMIMGEPLTGQAFTSRLILLADYSLVTCIANRVVTGIFIREVRLRIELQLANERLREIDRIKSEFFANISHELRTPLTLILAPAASLKREEPGPLLDGQRSLVDSILRNAARLLSLINDLLLLARLDSGRVERKRDPVDLAGAIARVMATVEPHARSLGLSTQVTFADALPQWHGDPRHAERILLNLVSNACKFSRPGGAIRVRVEANPEGLVLSVSDDGIGISEKDLAKIFDRFVQVESAANRRFEGTGIGLAIVKELAELYGGRVEVESKLGQGSTFRILLPDAQRALGPPPVLETPAVGPEEPPPVEALLPGFPINSREPTGPRLVRGDDPSAPKDGRPRILVVEDNYDMLRYLAQELGRKYNVLALADSREAMQRAVEEPPDLILSDIMMPHMDGIELTRKLRTDARTKDVPILLLSARDEVETKLEGFAAGVADYVQKPFQPPELMARIELHLRLRDQAHSLERTARELSTAMAQLKETESTLIQNEKMASLGRVVAGVAHEINNPLHFLKGNLFLLKRRMERLLPPAELESAQPFFADLDTSVERIVHITRELLVLGRKEGEGATDVRLRDVVALVIKMVGPQAGPTVRLADELEGSETVRVNPQDLFQILLNVVYNAVQAVDPASGVVKIQSAPRERMVELRIADNGCGIAPENLSRIFEPFFTTKPTGQGTGLGLAIVQKLVQAQGGTVEVTSVVGGGTTITLLFPRSQSAAQETVATLRAVQGAV